MISDYSDIFTGFWLPSDRSVRRCQAAHNRDYRRPQPTPRNQLLDEVGWKRGPDGIRTKDGKRPKLLFQTSINAPHQKTQAIVKQACQRAGIDMELKSVTPSVYFSSDAANPDTARKFYADIQMPTTGVGAPPDPEGLMRQFLSSEIAARKTNGSVVIPPAGTTRRTTTCSMPPKVNLTGQASGALHCHERVSVRRLPQFAVLDADIFD
jgi:hypothetical protein